MLHYCFYHCTFLNFSLLDGGHASGFKEGKKKFKKALLQVKGKRKVYASQVSLVSFWIKIMQTSCMYRVRMHLESPWKSLKIEVGAGKSLNFSANFIQFSKHKQRNNFRIKLLTCWGRTKKDINSLGSFFARNGVLEKGKMCPWKSLNFLFKRVCEPCI